MKKKSIKNRFKTSSIIDAGEYEQRQIVLEQEEQKPKAYKRREGSFFPYVNLTDIDLTRYQIPNQYDKSMDTKKLLKDNCIIHAFKKVIKDKAIINKMRLYLGTDTRNVLATKINDLCRKFKLHVKIHNMSINEKKRK